MTVRERRIAWAAWAFICVVWGTTYLAIKVSLDTIPPMLMGGLRYTISGGVLAMVLWARGDALPPRETWPRFLLLGFLLLGLGNGGVITGELWLPSGLAAVLIAATPFWMVGIEALIPGGERLHARHFAGLALGFIGIVTLVWPDGSSTASVGGWRLVAGVAALQLACAGWSIGSAYARRSTRDLNPLASAALQMLAGGFWMLLAGTLLGEWPLLHFTTRTGLALTYLTFVGGLAGFAAYAYALKHLPTSKLSLYAYVNPVIAVILGAVLLHEPFTARMAVAIAIILSGMAIVSWKRAEPSRANAHASSPGSPQPVPERVGARA